MGSEGERRTQECPSSVVTVSTPPPTLRPSPYHGSPTQCTQSLLERKQKDTCFRCGKQGHWAQDCLSGTPTKASPPQDIHQLPVLRSLLERKQKDTCFRCGEQGHWAQDCLSRTPTKASPPQNIHQLPVLRSLLERKQKDTCFRCGEQGHWVQDCLPGTPTKASPPQDVHRLPVLRSLLERKQKDTCFRCGEQGHWAQDCLLGTPTKASPPQDVHQLPVLRSLLERKQKDTCFRCGEQGHWAQDCLSGTPTKASPPQDIHQLPVLCCHCGVVHTINVSHREANPGRSYYSRNCNCDNKATQGKNVYQWCDNVMAPMCKCRAGTCTINIIRDNEGKETKHYTCRIRAGHGSCGFLQSEGPSNPWPRFSDKDKRPSISSPPNSESTNVMANEDECPIPSFPNRDIVVCELETCNSVMRKGCRVSRLSSRSDIRSRQIEFWNQISADSNSPDQYEVFQMLGFHFHGWLGRLAFPPPRILEEALPRNFFCLLVSAYVDVSDGRSSGIIPHASSNAGVDENALANDTQLPSVPLRTSSLKRSFSAMQADVINSNTKEVRKKPQKDVPNLLESIQPAYHDTMLQAANATFDALASVESIQCMSSVPLMESTLQDNCNLQVPTINISGIQAEAFAALTAASNRYLQSVHKVASHFKDMLGQFEKLETCLLDIAKDMGQSKRRMQATYQELTEAWKLQQEEEEQCMARTGIR